MMLAWRRFQSDRLCGRFIQESLLSQAAFGPYVITRELPPSRVGKRLLAVHERDRTSHVVHVLSIGASRSQQRRGLARVEAWARSTKGIPSTLGVQCWSLWTHGKLALVTPYTGSSQGLVTLETLLAGRGGRLPLTEGVRAITPLLSTLRESQARGVAHGPLSMGEILVDQHGQVCVEHFGLVVALSGQASDEAGERSRFVGQEVASLASIAVRLVVGRTPGEAWADAKANSPAAAEAAVAAWVRGFVLGGAAVATATAAGEALVALLRECERSGEGDSRRPDPGSPANVETPFQVPRAGGLKGVVDRILGVFRRSPR